MHLSASTALSAYYANIDLSASTALSAVTPSLLLSAGTAMHFYGGTALSMRTSTLALSASGNMHFYVASSLSFTYASGATYNMFPIATATATSSSYSATISGGPYAGLRVTRSRTSSAYLQQVETHTFTITTMYNNGYCLASWNTIAYDSNGDSWQISASCSATQMIGYLHLNGGTSANTNAAISTNPAYTIFLVQ
jgi:hypothetical protein